MAVHKVNPDDLKVGASVEQQEHPWASERTARRIARDHLQENPKAYSGNKANNQRENIIVLNQNIKVKPTKPKKKPVPKNQPPAWQTWGRELL